MKRLEDELESKNKIYQELKKNSPEKLQKMFDDTRKKLDLNQLKTQKNLAAVMELEESLQEIHKVGDRCPICDNTLSPKKKRDIITKRRNTIKKLKLESKKMQP